jgi:hypothetical protein
MSVFVASVIRSIVPIIVGAVASWFVSIGVELEPEGLVALSSFLTALFGALYYVGVRLLEEKVPAFGWLLGLAKSPDSYTRSVPKKNGRHEAV